jgi:hypothetical protein
MVHAIIGRVTVHDDYFVAEMRDIASLLDQEVGDKYGRYCRHTLGESVIYRGVETSCGIVLDPPVWEPSTAVTELSARKATTYDGRRYVCTTAGTTASSEPSWNTTLGGTTTDGSAVWTCYSAYTYQGSVTSVVDAQVFQDATLNDPDNVFAWGVLTFTSGQNAGTSMDVQTVSPDGVITLQFPVPLAVSVGDTFRVSVGCNKLLKMPGDVWGEGYTGHCRVKFSPETGGNARQFGGEPETPGNDAVLNVL